MTATLPDAPAATDDLHADPLRDALVQAVGAEYELLRLLGRGGMGAVYLARDKALERLVAIKVLPPGAGTDAAAIERFRREARTVAALQHGAIVPLFAFGERRGLCWFVMGYVRGESLASRIEREGALEPEAARAILAQLADALDHAHRQGVVHRDIKPDNVLIDDTTGRALLTDFGIARADAARAATALTQGGAVLGTPHYMSPEQATAESGIDGRSDLYSVGVMGYEMLAGRLPFAGGSFRELVLQHVSVTPTPLAQVAPQVPSDLADAVMRCLAKEPGDRFADAGALRGALGGSAYDDEALAYELADLRHLAAWTLVVLVVAGVCLAALAITGAELQWLAGGVPGALLGSLAIVAQMREARKRGFEWSTIRRVVLLPPRWWYLPWPAAWRRTTDVHAKLPAPLRWTRRINVGITLGFGVFALVFAHAKRQIDLDIRSLVPGPHATYTLRGFASLPLLGDLVLMIAILLGIVVGYAVMMMLAARVARPHGLGWSDWQRLALKSTDAPFWRDARVRPVLGGTTPAALAEPSTPEEFVTRILAVARTTTAGGTRDTGADAGSAARRLLEAIGGVDRELESLARTAPAEQLERVDAALVLVESEGGDEEAIALLTAQRDTLQRARERAVRLGERRAAAVAELETLWREVRRLRDTPDPGAARDLAAQLKVRAESIERTWPPRTRGATRRVTGAALAGVLTLGALAATPTHAGPDVTPAQARVAALLDRGATDSALAALDALDDAGDESTERWRLAGRAALQHGNTTAPFTEVVATPRALRAFATVVARDSSDVFALEHLVWLHRLAPTILGGRDDEGRAALARLARIAPYRAALLRGYLARLDGEPRVALARFRALVVAHPDSAPAWFALADAQGRDDNADAALAAYERYRALAPTDPTTDFHLGTLASRLGVRTADGEAALRRYVQRAWRPGMPTIDAAFWRLGQLLEKRGQPAEARVAYQRAIVLRPKDDEYRASLRALTDTSATTR
jgi:tetratricopeptide (TPR) repeat protein